MEARQKPKISVDSRTSFARRPRNDPFSLQSSKVIHRSSLTMESEVSLNFATGWWKARFALLLPNEIEDFLLACSELGHRCSIEHYTSPVKPANIISDCCSRVS